MLLAVLDLHVHVLTSGKVLNPDFCYTYTLLLLHICMTVNIKATLNSIVNKGSRHLPGIQVFGNSFRGDIHEPMCDFITDFITEMLTTFHFSFLY